MRPSPSVSSANPCLSSRGVAAAPVHRCLAASWQSACRAVLLAPPAAINNQRSHLAEDLGRLEQTIQRDIQRDEEDQLSHHQHKRSKPNSHVFHQTPQHHHVQHAEAHDHSSLHHHDAVTSTRATSATKQQQQHANGAHAPYRGLALHRAPLDSYARASQAVNELVSVLSAGGKALIDFPEDPEYVSRFLAVAGYTAATLRKQNGLVLALDPVVDASPASGAAAAASAALNGHGHDAASLHAIMHARAHCYALIARAVPLPPAHSAGDSSAPVYVVGSEIGQEVLKATPHGDGQPTLCTRLLRGVLRDGLVTVRCNWQDDDLAATTSLQDSELEECPAEGLLDGPGEDPDALDAAAMLSNPDTQVGLVRVPPVLRALFKVDRQLRSHGLSGLVVLPHTFTACSEGGTLLVHLDMVMA